MIKKIIFAVVIGVAFESAILVKLLPFFDVLFVDEKLQKIPEVKVSKDKIYELSKTDFDRHGVYDLAVSKDGRYIGFYYDLKPTIVDTDSNKKVYEYEESFAEDYDARSVFYYNELFVFSNYEKGHSLIYDMQTQKGELKAFYSSAHLQDQSSLLYRYAENRVEVIELEHFNKIVIEPTEILKQLPGSDRKYITPLTLLANGDLLLKADYYMADKGRYSTCYVALDLKNNSWKTIWEMDAPVRDAILSKSGIPKMAEANFEPKVDACSGSFIDYFFKSNSYMRDWRFFVVDDDSGEINFAHDSVRSYAYDPKSRKIFYNLRFHKRLIFIRDEKNEILGYMNVGDEINFFKKVPDKNLIIFVDDCGINKIQWD